MTSRCVARTVVALVAAAALAGCNADVATSETAPPNSDATAGATTSSTPTTSPTSTTTGTTTTTTTTSTTTSSTTTTTTTTTSTSTLPPGTPAPGTLDLTADTVLLGTSVEGRPIIAERYGDAGRRVLVIGVIHGNEDDGVAVIDDLRRRDVPDGIELWLVESMNPDGQLAQDRHNARDVDLNRNFPYDWGPIGVPGDGQYAGTGPASEPETQAMVKFIDQLRPDITIWYHQDANLIIPSTGRDGRIRARYAELTGLPLAQLGGTGGVYTGVAATWARNALRDQEAVAFIVELGPTLSPDEAVLHADSVLTIAVEG